MVGAQARMLNDRNTRCSVLLFCTAFYAYGLIFSGFHNDNTTSRIGLSVSLADRGSLYIDDFAPWTHDKATLSGRFASSKAPGMSFLALPAVAVAVRIERLLDPNIQWVHPTGLDSRLEWLLRLATLTTSSLYTALAVVALFRIALLLNVTVQGALFCSIVYGFATPTWGWATTFFSHATCGAFLVFGLWVVILATTPGRQWSTTRTVASAVAAGVLLGLAIVIEYTSALAALFIAAYGVWRSLHLTPERTLCAIGSAIVGALIVGIPLMLYNNALFGSPFSISYSYSDYHEMQKGLWGIHWPNPTIALKILFSGERGLFWLSPILVLAPIAWWKMETAGERAPMVLCLAIFISFWIINSGFWQWEAGFSTGPRYLTPSLPFLALPFAWLWEKSRTLMRSTLLGLAILSIIICFAMAGIEVLDPHITQSMVDKNFIYKEFIDKNIIYTDFNVVTQTLLPNFAAVNIKNLVFKQSFAPLYIFVICFCLVTLWRYTYVFDPQSYRDVYTKTGLVWAYIEMACITFFLQIWMRICQCHGLVSCSASFIRGAIWSLIWPISWIVYLAGALRGY